MRVLPGERSSLTLGRAKTLRREMTPAERKLWGALRNGGLSGAKVKRQAPAGPYILDFVFTSERLAIELDGHSHDSAEGAARDEARDAWLQAHGVRVLRFANLDVLSNLEGVVTAISAALDRPHPDPLPLAWERGK